MAPLSEPSERCNEGRVVNICQETRAAASEDRFVEEEYLYTSPQHCTPSRTDFVSRRVFVWKREGKVGGEEK